MAVSTQQSVAVNLAISGLAEVPAYPLNFVKTLIQVITN